MEAIQGGMLHIHTEPKKKLTRDTKLSVRLSYLLGLGVKSVSYGLAADPERVRAHSRQLQFLRQEEDPISIAMPPLSVTDHEEERRGSILLLDVAFGVSAILTLQSRPRPQHCYGRLV